MLRLVSGSYRDFHYMYDAPSTPALIRSVYRLFLRVNRLVSKDARLSKERHNDRVWN